MELKYTKISAKSALFFYYYYLHKIKQRPINDKGEDIIYFKFHKLMRTLKIIFQLFNVVDWTHLLILKIPLHMYVALK